MLNEKKNNISFYSTWYHNILRLNSDNKYKSYQNKNANVTKNCTILYELYVRGKSDQDT